MPYMKPFGNLLMNAVGDLEASVRTEGFLDLTTILS
jgi:hypothetical protein